MLFLSIEEEISTEKDIKHEVEAAALAAAVAVVSIYLFIYLFIIIHKGFPSLNVHVKD